jgi:hypothetical protein
MAMSDGMIGSEEGLKEKEENTLRNNKAFSAIVACRTPDSLRGRGTIISWWT